MICYVRVVDGVLRTRQKVRVWSTGSTFEAAEVGIFAPQMQKTSELTTGQVGYFTAAIKDVREVRVGDTVTGHPHACQAPLPGYREPQQVVFAGLFTVENESFEDLREALGKLRLNDASFGFEPDTSVALGFGFRCGFLGLLHMEIIQERLEREFDLDLVTTAPTVLYEVLLPDGTVRQLRNPAHLPDQFQEVREPFILANLYTPQDYMGSLMDLCRERRGEVKKVDTLGGKRVRIEAELPFAEVLVDFNDKLKSMTRGYASMDYSFLAPRASDLVRLDIHVAGEPVDAFCSIVPRDRAFNRGNDLARKLKELIPRQLFEVPIQAMIGGRAIARTNIKALRKNVLAKCYGGDITRKRKLLEKQKKGKKRMKQVGKVFIPQEAFMSVLKAE